MKNGIDHFNFLLQYMNKHVSDQTNFIMAVKAYEATQTQKYPFLDGET